MWLHSDIYLFDCSSNQLVYKGLQFHSHSSTLWTDESLWQPFTHIHNSSYSFSLTMFAAFFSIVARVCVCMCVREMVVVGSVESPSECVNGNTNTCRLRHDVIVCYMVVFNGSGTDFGYTQYNCIIIQNEILAANLGSQYFSFLARVDSRLSFPSLLLGQSLSVSSSLLPRQLYSTRSCAAHCHAAFKVT